LAAGAGAGWLSVAAEPLKACIQSAARLKNPVIRPPVVKRLSCRQAVEANAELRNGTKGDIRQLQR
jgi:hypothetical protein